MRKTKVWTGEKYEDRFYDDEYGYYLRPNGAPARVRLGVPKAVVDEARLRIKLIGRELFPCKNLQQCNYYFVQIELARLIDLSPSVGVELLINLERKNRRRYEQVAKAVRWSIAHFPDQSDLLGSGEFRRAYARAVECADR